MGLREFLFGPEPPPHVAIDLSPPPRPRLAAVTFAPARDEYAAWRDEPVTRFVFAALRAAQTEQKHAWDAYAWDGQSADGEELAANLLVLKTRADAYAALEEADYDALCEWAGLDGERGESAA